MLPATPIQLTVPSNNPLSERSDFESASKIAALNLSFIRLLGARLPAAIPPSERYFKIPSGHKLKNIAEGYWASRELVKRRKKEEALVRKGFSN